MVIHIKRKTFRRIVRTFFVALIILIGIGIKALFFGGEECSKTMVQGRNPKTGEVKDFRTTCDVPRGWDTLELGGGREIKRGDITSRVYWNSDMGLSFEYIINPNGYTLFDIGKQETDTPNLVAHIVIKNTAEHKEASESKQAREGPPEISIQVFDDTSNVDLFTWLNTNTSITRYDKEKHPIALSKVGGVEALEFLTDGLYITKNYIAESNGKIYLISGPDDDSFSQIKKDFETLVASIVIF